MMEGNFPHQYHLPVAYLVLFGFCSMNEPWIYLPSLVEAVEKANGVNKEKC